MIYRNWIIYPAETSYHRSTDWRAHHRDYDGPEDCRVTYGATLDEVKADIDEYEDDDGFDLMSLGLVCWGVMVTIVAITAQFI